MIPELKVVTVGNPRLQPEHTDGWFGSVVLEPKGALRNLEITIDGFSYQRRNLLQQPGTYMGYSRFLFEAAQTSSPYAGRVVRDTPAPGQPYGQVLYIRDDFDNLSDGLTRGMDIGANYRWDLGDFGKLLTGASVTWYDRQEVDGVDYVGTRFFPRWGANASVEWRRGVWLVDLYGVARGPRKGTIDMGSVFEPGDFPPGSDYVQQPDDLFVEYRIRPQYTLNASVAYKGIKHTTITFGVNNIFDTPPPLDPQEGIGTTPGINDPEPAFWFMSVEREF
jgi:iron complex outermembrane receptor protein